MQDKEQASRARKNVTFSGNIEDTNLSNENVLPFHIQSSLRQTTDLDYQSFKASEKGLKGILQTFSAPYAFYDLLQGSCKEWDNRELDIFNGLKFFTIFLILITCTALYLVLADGTNPWLIASLMDNPIYTILISGLVAIDTFFTFSAFFAFYRISQIYDAQGGLGFKDILKIYAKRLLRILPLYYLTFMVGMFLIPRVTDGGVWYMLEQALFFECDKYWWANLLLISNFVPWDQSAKSGCMPWGWVLAADFQLYLFIPFYVIMYKKSRKIGLAVMWLLLVIGMIIVVCVVMANNLTSGAYTLENWYLYSAFLNKPYCKLQVHIIGILGAVLYLDVLEYRKDPLRASKTFKKLDFCMKNWIFGKVLLYIGLGMVIANLFIAFSCTLNPYDWTRFGNGLFYVYTRTSFALGYMCIAFYIIFGHSSIGQSILGNRIFTASGKLVYIVYLISPIIMMVIYSATRTGVFLTVLFCIYLGVGHVIFAFTCGFAIYMFLLWPVNRAIDLLIHPFVGYDHIIRKQKVIQSKQSESSETQTQQ